MSQNPSHLSTENLKQAVQALAKEAGLNPRITVDAVDLATFLSFISGQDYEVEAEELKALDEDVKEFLTNELADGHDLWAVVIVLWSHLLLMEQSQRKPKKQEEVSPMFA